MYRICKFQSVLGFLMLSQFNVIPSIVKSEDVLPTHVVPTHYTLEFEVDPKSSTYNGFVQINFSSPTALHDIIKFHASQETIEIQYAILNYNHTCTVTEYDNSSEIATLTCPARSFGNDYGNVLLISFQGQVATEEMKGLYKAVYKEDGNEHALLATRFEPVDARRAFPCLDEPKWKSTFDIFVTHPKDYIALANTPVLQQFSVAPNQVQTQFATTPPMSTYLVAFIVSQFVSKGSNDNKDYDYKVFSRPNTKDSTGVANTYGPYLLDVLSNWTGTDYKDLGDSQAYQVAIPDFSAEAVENWGLITFREEDILDEKDITSNYVKQRIITKLAHELANQWFGNYVTLNSWSDVWVNEGIGTYFGYYIPDQLSDNLETMMQFVVDKLQPVLQDDAVSSSLPLSNRDNDDDVTACDTQFNDICRSKSNMIRMLRNFIGEDAFKEGLQLYLSTYKYNNSSPSLLLNSFNVETALDLNKIMDNWVYKSGFPLVTAKLNGSTVVLTQEKFMLKSSNGAEETQWYIPISYTTKAEKSFDIEVRGWLDPNSTFTIEMDDDSWIILNIQQASYYRVNYDDTLWQRIINDLRKSRKDIHILNRAQLLDDVFNIARTGQVSYQTAFHLAEYLSSETEYYPWVSALNAMDFISGKLGDDDVEKLLQDRILYWINKAFPPKSTIVGSGHVDKLKEVLILDWACRMGQEECIAYARETFQSYKTNHSLPDYNKRRIIFCYGYRYSSGAANDYDFLLNLFKSSASIVEQKEILSSLGCIRNSDLLLKYLSETIKEDSPIRKRDAGLVFDAAYSKNEIGVDISLHFLEDNLENITTTYKGMNILSNFILGLASKVASNNQISRLTKIIEDCSDIEDVKHIAQKAVDIATSNNNWATKYSVDIKKILQEPIIFDTGNIPKPNTLIFVVSSILFCLLMGK